MALFKNDYQGGSHLEILSSQGTTIKNWKLRGVKKIYQSDLKGSCHHVEGGKLNLPKNDKLHLYLYQPYLLFQLYITSGMPISIELCLIDMNNNHRRFLISTNNKETKTTALHISCPFPDLIKGQWMNVCFDLVNLLSDNFKGFTYKRLDSIGLNGTFRLRKICTIKDRPPETQMDNYSKYSDFKSIVELPKSILLPSDILSSTIVYDMQRILRIENRSLNTNDVIPAIIKHNIQFKLI
ncbi:hypothetical protein BC833DRAFT_215644 [Globomyces pollinis-pini]|nr:hypothetical protein BC833DRAFT_215644 [Globomyces pollinis-pini]